MDAVATAIWLLREKTCQSLSRNIGGNTDWIDATTGHSDSPAVDVGGKHLYGVALLECLHALLKQDGNGIGLLTSGTASSPDPHYAASGLVGKKLGNDLIFEHLEGFRVTKEIGHTN